VGGNIIATSFEKQAIEKLHHDWGKTTEYLVHERTFESSVVKDGCNLK
jgi:hypothetical protein